jgi:hypothetical protein
MTTSTHRRSSRRRVVGLVAVALLVSGWPAHAQYETLVPAVLTAFGGRYMPGCGPFPWGPIPGSARDCKELTVDYGQAAEFFNADNGVAHDVTEFNPDGPPRFATGVVPAGAHENVVGVAKMTQGRYRFFCKVHPDMRGMLHVVSGPSGIG